MPELPEITNLACQMNAALVARRIAAVEVLQPKSLNVSAEAFASVLAGAEIMAAGHHGKWLRVQMDRGWLLLNLGMGGEILLTDRAHMPQKYRLAFDLADGACLAINFWWFGYAHYAADWREHPMVGKLGPHFMDLTLDDFRALLRGKRGAIKTFLLDQNRLAGIGNVYVQDPLFRARIHPLRPIPSLSDDEIVALYRALCALLQESIDLGGAAFELNLYGKHGGWGIERMSVAYREGAQCPACGAPIAKIKTGSTAGYVCPTCQQL